MAFAIAALALAALFPAMIGGLRSSKVAAQYEIAASRAKSHLAALGRDMKLVAGDREGDDGGGYHWHVHIAPIGTTRNPPTTTGEPGPPTTLYAVRVVISWAAGNGRRQVALESERLAPGTVSGP